MQTDLPDGLYRVDHHSVCAGVVVENGRVTMCAPILRKRLAWWLNHPTTYRIGD